MLRHLEARAIQIQNRANFLGGGAILPGLFLRAGEPIYTKFGEDIGNSLKFLKYD